VIGRRRRPSNGRDNAPVVVDAEAADGVVAGVLLDGGRGPAAEGGEVGEGRVAVVVGVCIPTN